MLLGLGSTKISKLGKDMKIYTYIYEDIHRRIYVSEGCELVSSHYFRLLHDGNSAAAELGIEASSRKVFPCLIPCPFITIFLLIVFIILVSFLNFVLSMSTHEIVVFMLNH